MALERNGTPNGTAVETHMLVNATGDTNHNKFWKCILFDSQDVQVFYGRIGVTSSDGVERCGGKSYMLQKMAEKFKGKVNKKTQQREPYTEIAVMDTDTGGQTGSSSRSGTVKAVAKSELASIATKQIQHSSPQTAKLIKWLADVNRHNIHKATGGQVTWNAKTGLFTTPLGIIPPASISSARALLISIADHVAQIDDTKYRYHGRWTHNPFVRNVEEYLTLVPHNLGMKWSPQGFVPNLTAVQRENGILDALDASYASATSVTPKKATKAVAKKADPKLFETKLVMVKDGKVIDRIRKKFRDSSNRSHYQVRDLKVNVVWTVEVGPMAKAFTLGKKVGNIKELWHGTQASNLLSILKVGLIIPPSSSSHCTGRMFGDGLYFSDQSTKALNYATSFWGGQDVGRYFMFLATVAMGREYTPKRYGGMRNAPSGYDSTFAKAGQSGVQNNEMIVYKTAQASLVYLIEFGK